LLLGACTSWHLLRSNLESSVVLIKDLKHTIKENTELKHKVAYLTSRLERTIVSEKMIENDLSRIEESATKSTYKLDVGFEMCENKGEKRANKFVPTSNYHKEEETIKSTKTHCPSNPKPSFNPRREVRKEIPKPREESFVYMFCGRAGHLDDFCFCRKRIEKMRFDYVRNSYHDEFSDFLPCSYSHALPRSSSHALSHFSHGPNHRSYGFGSRENNFVARRFGYNPRPHHGDCFSCRPGLSAGGSYTHFEPRHLDGQRFPRRGSHPTGSNGEVIKTVKTSSSRMVKC
jgi:hypothetical protein